MQSYKLLGRTLEEAVHAIFATFAGGHPLKNLHHLQEMAGTSKLGSCFLPVMQSGFLP